MSNAFDSANYPTTEPAKLVAGDRWAWKRTDLGNDYPPASYTLKYSMRQDGAAPAAEIEITATASGTAFVIEVGQSDTLSKSPGRYRWQAYIVRDSDSERITIAAGALEVVANRDSAPDDPRTHARKVLDSIESAIESLATDAVQSYTIATGSGSRSVTKRDMKELIDMRNRYQREVADEEAALRGNDNRHIGIQFVRR
jgi:hypothetical protein